MSKMLEIPDGMEKKVKIALQHEAQAQQEIARNTSPSVSQTYLKVALDLLELAEQLDY